MSSVSMLMMGQQAVIDAVLCLAHLSSGATLPSLAWLDLGPQNREAAVPECLF